jgi:hypothetical protein
MSLLTTRQVLSIEGSLSYFSTFAYRGVHINERALLDINFIWLSLSLAYPNGEEEGILHISDDFYLPF